MKIKTRTKKTIEKQDVKSNGSFLRSMCRTREGLEDRSNTVPILHALKAKLWRFTVH